MTRRDYHPLTPRQRIVLLALASFGPDGLGTGPLAQATGLTYKQAKGTAEGLRKRGAVILFTYRGGAQVWRVAPEESQ